MPDIIINIPLCFMYNQVHGSARKRVFNREVLDREIGKDVGLKDPWRLE